VGGEKCILSSNKKTGKGESAGCFNKEVQAARGADSHLVWGRHVHKKLEKTVWRGYIRAVGRKICVKGEEPKEDPLNRDSKRKLQKNKRKKGSQGLEANLNTIQSRGYRKKRSRILVS